MGTRALAVLLLAPSLALAQTAGVLVANPLEVGRANCSTGAGTTVSLTWTSSSTPASGNTWRVAVYADTDTCPTTAVTSTASNVIVQNQLSAGTATAVATVSSDVIAVAGGVTCIPVGTTPAADVAKKICVWLVTSPGGTEVSVLAAQGPFTFQFARPPPPVLDGIRPANGALIVDFHPGADSGLDDAAPDVYRVYIYGPTADPTCTVTPPTPIPVDPKCLIGTQDVTGSGSRIGGLANNTQYTLDLTAISSGGNESSPSASGTGTPLPFVSFWENYQSAGGREQGGCGGGAGALSLLALLPLALRRRRR